MQPSQACIKLIKSFEGCNLTAYACPAGKPTNGVGHTDGVKLGTVITQEQADANLLSDLQTASDAISRYVKVPLTQAQFDSLCSFIFNVGSYAFLGSTLLLKLNGGLYAEAAEEFLRWDHVGKKTLSGLTRRREAERAMFLNLDQFGP